MLSPREPPAAEMVTVNRTRPPKSVPGVEIGTGVPAAAARRPAAPRAGPRAPILTGFGAAPVTVRFLKPLRNLSCRRAFPSDSAEDAGGRDSRRTPRSTNADDVAPFGAEDACPGSPRRPSTNRHRERAPQVADAAEDGGGERLDPEEETRRRYLVVSDLRACRGSSRDPGHQFTAEEEGHPGRSVELTPIRAAVSGSSTVARMPRPSRNDGRTGRADVIHDGRPDDQHVDAGDL